MAMISEREALTWIAELFEEKPERLSPGSLRKDIATWDSLGVLTLMAGLDSGFGIVLTDDEVVKMKSVGDILDVMRRNGALA